MESSTGQSEHQQNELHCNEWTLPIDSVRFTSSFVGVIEVDEAMACSDDCSAVTAIQPDNKGSIALMTAHKKQRRRDPLKRKSARVIRAGDVVEVHDIRSTDVLFGRGKFEREHHGNQRMKELLNLHREAYQATSDRRVKFTLTKIIVDTIKRNGDRFLKYDTTRQSWSMVDDKVARHKVSHAMRDTHYTKVSTPSLSCSTLTSSPKTTWDTSSDTSSLESSYSKNSPSPAMMHSIFDDPADVDLMIDLFSSNPTMS